MTDHDDVARAGWLEAIARAVNGPYAGECDGIVTRDGHEEPCEKPTTCIIDDPEGGPWPACVWHAHRYSGGCMVTLAEIREALT